MSPEEMLDRLPGSARESIAHWPFADLPLRPGVSPEMLIRQVGNPLVRIAGVVYPTPEPVEALRLRQGNPAGVRPYTWVELQAPGDPHRYRQLAGLMMDVSVALGSPEGRYYRTGILHAVHGIELPLRPGSSDPRGVIRGIVQAADCSPLTKESYGMHLQTGDDRVVRIGWNQSFSVPLHQAGILEPGSAISMEVEQLGVMSYKSHIASGSYHLLEAPNLVE